MEGQGGSDGGNRKKGKGGTMRREIHLPPLAGQKLNTTAKHVMKRTKGNNFVVT